MDSVSYSQVIRRSGMIFSPEIHFPALGIAMIQHLARAGGVDASDDFEEDQPLSKAFPDGFAWGHFVTLIGHFSTGVKQKTLDVLLATITTLLVTLRALGGTAFAWRIWCAIFESTLGSAEIEWTKGSDTATLRVRDPDEAKDRGWDSHFPLYHLMVWGTLQRSLKSGQVNPLLTYAASAPQGHHYRKIADGLLRFVYDRGVEQVGAAYGDAVTGSIMAHVARANPHLLDPGVGADAVSQQYAANIFGGQNHSVIAAGSAGDWASKMGKLLSHELGRAPAFPVAGQTLRALDALVDAHHFGAVRRHHDGSTSKHSGLDLPAANGTGLVALYSGVVVEARGDWQSDDAKNKTPGWDKGNYVVIDSVAPSGAVLRHGYYHLSAVSVAKGDKVGQGVSIGQLGSTGNSTGPHLHLTAHWREDVNGDGVPDRQTALDPERVLEAGAVTTARQTGLSIGDVDDARPVLSPVVWTLSSIVSGAQMTPAVAALPVYIPSIDRPAQGGVWDSVNEFGRNMTNKMLGVMESGPGRAALSTAWQAVGVPPGAYDAMVNALRRGFETSAQSGAGVSDVLKAALSALDQKAVSQAASAAASQVLTQAAAEGGVEGIGEALGYTAQQLGGLLGDDSLGGELGLDLSELADLSLGGADDDEYDDDDI